MITDINIKQLLDSLYVQYNRYLSSDDPIWLIHNLQDKKDKEIMAFILSCYCYGNIKQIKKFGNKFLERCDNNPNEFILNFQERDLGDLEFYYRFNTHQDFVELCGILNKVLVEYGSLKALFLENYIETDDNILNALKKFVDNLRKYRNGKSKTFEYLLPRLERNSTAKRLMLFMKWMVRKDEIDIGLWKEVKTSQLIMPIDTHIYKNSLKLGLTKRKSCDMKFALEVTESLKKFDKDDPLKYDFALCHMGKAMINFQ